MNKKLWIVLTVIVMLVVTRFVVRIVDATVQIDDDLAALAALLIAVNGLIAFVSYKLYKR